MQDSLVERVLIAAEQIPPGRVASYGDLAGLLGIGPRQVGRVLATHGGSVPWWRVTNSSGDVPAHLRAEARPHWAAEGITWKPNGLGCRIAEFRADPAQLARGYDRASAHLGPGR